MIQAVSIQVGIWFNFYKSEINTEPFGSWQTVADERTRCVGG